jgi:sugar phosphate isomerase/epimerase
MSRASNDSSSERHLVAVALDGLGLEPREAFAVLRDAGVSAVQWPAMRPGLRPRDLDASARRDLVSTLRRHELAMNGVDLWIPPEHFGEADRVDRAVAAVEESVRFAAEFGRCAVSMRLPRAAATSPDDGGLGSVLAAVAGIAERHGVRLADHAVPVVSSESWSIGLDPVALLAAGIDPAAAAMEHAGRIAAARLADLDRGGLRAPVGDPIDGRLDVVRYRIGLEVAGFGGLVAIDPRQWADPLAGVRRAAGAWTDAGRPAGWSH